MHLGITATQRLHCCNPLSHVHETWGLKRKQEQEAYHRGHGELHGLDGVSIVSLLVGEGGVLGDELVQAHHGHSVSTGHILNCLLSPANPLTNCLCLYNKDKATCRRVEDLILQIVVVLGHVGSVTHND